jgi:Skp family chaperone for outer membrane proteins
MRNLLKWLVPGTLLFLLTSSSSFAQNKIATVDLSRVFTNYWKYQQASGALEDLKSDLNKTGKQLVDDFQKMKEDYQKLLADANNQAVSEKERDQRKKAAEDKLVEARKQEERINEFDQRARGTLAERSMTMRNNLLTEIRATVNSKAKAGGFTLVFDTAAQSADRTPVVLYASSEDLTDAVLAQLNAAAPMDLPSTDTKKPDEKKPDEKKLNGKK